MEKVPKYQISVFKSLNIEELEVDVNNFLDILTQEDCRGELVDIKWSVCSFDPNLVGSEVLFTAIVIFKDLEN